MASFYITVFHILQSVYTIVSYIYTVFLCTYCKAYTALLSMKWLYTVLSVKYSAYAELQCSGSNWVEPFHQLPCSSRHGWWHGQPMWPLCHLWLRVCAFVSFLSFLSFLVLLLLGPLILFLRIQLLVSVHFILWLLRISTNPRPLPRPPLILTLLMFLSP